MFTPSSLLGIDRRSLIEETIVYADSWNVYISNGLGRNTRKLLRQVKRRSGIEYFDPVYDSYYQPSLSPDGTMVACVRIKNDYHTGSSPELSKIQKYEGVLYSIEKKQEFIFFSSPGGNYKRVGLNVVEDNILSPIWSADGNKIYFLVSNRLLSYDLNLRKIQQVSELAPGHGGIVQLDMEYIRLSKD